MTYFPIFLNLKNREVLVIGGADVAFRKFKKLQISDAKITLISEHFVDAFNPFKKKRNITFITKTISTKDILSSTFLVISTLGDNKTNQQLKTKAHQKNILFNQVTLDTDNDFILPATHTQGKLQISISTSGVSPLLAKKIREKLKKQYGIEYSIFLNYLDLFRKKVIANNTIKSRLEIFKKMTAFSFLRLIKNNKQVIAKEQLFKLSKETDLK